MTNSPEINEFYKVLIENQNSTLQLVSFILLTITIILLGASFLWNFYLSNKKIEDAINIQKKNLEDHFSKQMNEIENNLMNKISTKLESTINFIRADTSRIFALHTYSNDLFDTSLNWWIDCLEYTLKNGNETHVRYIIDTMIIVLENPKFTEYSKDSLDINNGKIIINTISDALKPEKEKILKKIEKLKEKKTDE